MVPLTNGVVRSFGHTRLNIAGMDFTGGFKSISRSRKRSRKKVRSNNVDPVGKTLGTNDYSCKAVVFLDWYYNLIAQVQAISPGYGDQAFTIYISYVGSGLVPYTDTVLGCTFDMDEGDDKDGEDELTREIDFEPLKILFNGLDDAEDSLYGPPV
jgi:hypothetical protein